MTRLEKEKKMKNSKKKEAEKLVSRKAIDLVKKDMRKLDGDNISLKIKKD